MYSQKIDSPERFVLQFFTRKVSYVTFSEGVKEVTSSPDCKMIKLPKHLITCFRHLNILTKTHSRVMTATTFSHQNDTGSCASTTRTKKILYLLLYSS